MTTIQGNPKFLKWLSAEVMHNDSKEWLLELEFLKDEYLFFIDLINWNTLQLIDFQAYSKSKKIIETLSSSKKTNEELYKSIRNHENNLETLVDEINKPEEEHIYKKEHEALKVLFKNHLKKHRELKSNLFNILKKIKKTEKQKRLIDVE
ncbi:hypothetical protein [Polaribacter sp. Hel1_85]|uniref:hypothetical protein n=1 Tax=Polaribacter sp. Hel1_85 TaxID=1250005 RepID=UPI00052DEBBC|nr:hypothetical protein [Polaribacter sp. Hel1_85]KGL62507.1 hypothetical protein PHEL85_2301 [Polaribacter sp. Hel1_85]